MNEIDNFAVCSRSFSQNIILRKELLSRYAGAYIVQNDKNININ